MSEHDESLARLLVAPNEGAAGVIRARLEAEGIPSRQHADSMFLGIWGASAPHATAVRVRQSDLERARIVLEDSRRESSDIDWSQVDLGDPEDELAARIARRAEELLRGRHIRPGRGLVWTIVLTFALLYGGVLGAVIWAFSYSGLIGAVIMIGCWLAALYAAVRASVRTEAHGV